jgi:hypothetical protein
MHVSLGRKFFESRARANAENFGGADLPQMGVRKLRLVQFFRARNRNTESIPICFSVPARAENFIPILLFVFLNSHKRE